MEYELIDAGPCRKRMFLKFTPEEIDTALDDSYAEINGYVQLKGFRKGKAPRRALEKRFPNEAAAGARQKLAETNIADVVKKENLQLLGGVTDKNRGEIPVQGKDFTIEVELDVAPEFELPEYKGLELAEQPVEVKDEAVDEAIDRYRKMFANYTEIDEPAEVGDVISVDFQAKMDDAVIMSMQDQRLRVEGEILFGLPCPDLVEKFKGAKAGDLVTLTITMPDDHPNVELRGRPAQIEVTVKKVERGELPELNDAFAAGLGMGTMENFRARIRDNLVNEAMMEARQKQEDEIVDKLLEAVDFEVPLDMVDSETDALVEQRRMRLVRTGVQNDAALKEQLDKYRPEAAKQALRKVRWGILASKVAEKEGITVSNEDMQMQIEALAQSYRTTTKKIIERIREFDGVAPMMAEILSIKVVQFITDHAKGGRLEKNADSESVNAAAAESVAKSDDQSCGCGHDHDHDHDHGHHHHDHGDSCGCGHHHH